MPLYMDELELDRQFADAIAISPKFRNWLLSKTKFNDQVPYAQLMYDEQLERHPNGYAKHWWCRVPKTEFAGILEDVPDAGKDRETDIFLVFENLVTHFRFAIHIENKPPQGKFLPGQAESYLPRARHMMNKPKYLSYEDFDTVIIAPEKFLSSDPRCTYFGNQISYEAISTFVPNFKIASI